VKNKGIYVLTGILVIAIGVVGATAYSNKKAIKASPFVAGEFMSIDEIIERINDVHKGN